MEQMLLAEGMVGLKERRLESLFLSGNFKQLVWLRSRVGSRTIEKLSQEKSGGQITQNLTCLSRKCERFSNFFNEVNVMAEKTERNIP